MNNRNVLVSPGRNNLARDKKKMKNEMLKRAQKNAYKLENIQNKEIQQITFEPMQSVFIFTWIQV